MESSSVNWAQNLQVTVINVSQSMINISHVYVLVARACKTYDVNLHNQNVNEIHISIQPNFDLYTTSLLRTPVTDMFYKTKR